MGLSPLAIAMVLKSTKDLSSEITLRLSVIDKEAESKLRARKKIAEYQLLLHQKKTMKFGLLTVILSSYCAWYESPNTEIIR